MTGTSSYGCRRKSILRTNSKAEKDVSGFPTPLKTTLMEIFNTMHLSAQPKTLLIALCPDFEVLKEYSAFIRLETSRGLAHENYPLNIIGLSRTRIPHIYQNQEASPDGIGSIQEDPTNSNVSLVTFHASPNGILHWVNTVMTLKALSPDQTLILFDMTKLQIPEIPIGNITEILEFLPKWVDNGNENGIIFDFGGTRRGVAVQNTNLAEIIEKLVVAGGMLGLHPEKDIYFLDRLVCPTLMLRSSKELKYQIRQATPADLRRLLELEDRCWINILRTPRAVLLQRIEVFPNGQFVILKDDVVVGVVYSQLLTSTNQLRYHTFKTVGNLHNAQGRTLQLLSINVLPECQDLGLGDLLLDFLLVFAGVKFGIDRVVGVTRCKNYPKFKSTMTLLTYIHSRTSQGLLLDPVLHFHEVHGGRVIGVIHNYRPGDADNSGIGVYVKYDLVPKSNPAEKRIRFRDLDIEKMVCEEIENLVPAEGKGMEFRKDLALLDMGLDSADLLQLRLSFESRLNLSVRPTFFFEHNTAASIISYFQKEVWDLESDGPNTITEVSSQPSSLSDCQNYIASEELKKTDAPVGIISMSCRLPGGIESVEKYWEVLKAAQDQISRVPESRFNINLYHKDGGSRNKISSSRGGFISQVDEFDHSFFNMTPREAEKLDPQHRILLELHWEACERAGISAESLKKSKTGVFVGISSHDYESVLKQQPGFTPDMYFATGVSAAAAAGRISYYFGFEGPSLVVDTACSSSLAAVHLAVQSLSSGECDLAFASGSNLILSPETSIGYSHAGMLSPEGKCRTFDVNANGFVRSEGIGVVLLQRSEDAVRDGNEILAIVAGSKMNHDGSSNGFTAPSLSSQVKLLEGALEKACIKPMAVTYLETHGTGTRLGDQVELEAIQKVYSEDHSPDNPLHLGSVKTIIGHTEAAAGIAGLIKLVLCLQNKWLVPNLHLSKQSQLVTPSLLALTEEMAWEPCFTEKLIGGVSSFGSTGTNVHVILEEYIQLQELNEKICSQRNLRLITFSGKTKSAVEDAIKNLSEYVINNNFESENLDNLAYTLNCCRPHFCYRSSFIVSDQDNLLDQLKSPGRISLSRDRPKLAFLFTGQGSQYFKMGSELYESNPMFRSLIESCSSELDFPILKFLYDPSSETSTNRYLINQTEYTQPMLFVLEYALARFWITLGIEPDFVMGHSVGEIVAAVVCGMIELKDGLKLIAMRGKLIQTLPSGGGMLAVVSEKELVLRLVRGMKLSVAAINSPTQVVLSGEIRVLQEARSKFEAQSIPSQFLAVSHAFHSTLMSPIVQEFEAVVSRIPYKAPQKYKFISNVTGEEIITALNGSYWCRHLVDTVQFANGLTHLYRVQKCSFSLEIGPNPILTHLGKACLRDEACTWLSSLKRGTSDWSNMLGSIATFYDQGFNINFEELDKHYYTHKLMLPVYPFQRVRHWPTGPNFGCLEVPKQESLGLKANYRSQNGFHEDGILQHERENTRRFRKSGKTAVESNPELKNACTKRQVQVVDVDEQNHEIAEEEVEISRIQATLNCSLNNSEKPAQTSETANSGDTGKLDCFYTEKWIELETTKNLISTQPWLLVSDDQKMLEYLGSLIPGQKVTIDKDLTPQLNQLFNIASSKQENKLGGVLFKYSSVFLATMDNLELLCTSFWTIVQSLLNQKITIETKIILVIETSESNCPLGSVLCGFLKSVKQEYPEFNTLSIELQRDSPPFSTRMLEESIGLPNAEARIRIGGLGKLFAPRIVAKQFEETKTFSGHTLDGTGTYLVTGGFGGIGKNVVRWMIRNGAKSLVLLHKSPLKAASLEFMHEISSLPTLRLKVAQIDIVNYSLLSNFIREINETSKIVGIFHLAGRIELGLMNSWLAHGWPTVENVLEPKVAGTWNLHRILEEESIVLQHFVLFSSISVVFDWAGISAYIASNMFLDAIAEVRRAKGQAALSIRWGTWIGEGMGSFISDSSLQMYGIEKLHAEDGLKALENLLQTHEQGVVMVTPIDWNAFSNMNTNYFSEVVPNFKSTILENPVLERNKESVRRFIVNAISSITGLQECEIDERRGFLDMGLDSGMIVQLRACISNEVPDQILSHTIAFDYPNVTALTNYVFGLFQTISNGQVPVEAEPSTDTSSENDAAPESVFGNHIAVIGIGCRFPGRASSPEGYWEVLKEGWSEVGPIPKSRFDVDLYYDPDPDAPGKMSTKEGAFLESIDQFDPGFFNISGREADWLDPQQRLLLEVTWEALERAAIRPDTLGGSKTGVFVGISSNDYARLIYGARNDGDSELEDPSLYMETGNSHSTASGRISYTLGLEGPCLSIDTACSSSLVAVHLAMRSLKSGECDLALAGGVNVILSPDVMVSLSKGRMLSPSGLCKTFDKEADGYARGEGCGMVLLKRLEDAIRDKNQILGIIRGSAMNQDGASAGLTAPNGSAQQQLIKEALKDAEVEPEQISFVEVHGTGTSLGDPIEVQALSKVYCPTPAHPLVMGTCKVNIGHLEAASGVAGLIKVLLSLENNMMPAHRNMSSLNPKINLIPGLSISAGQSWNDTTKLAGISSFGFSGTNVHLIVQGYKFTEYLSQPTRPIQLVTISAKSQGSLHAMVQKYQNHFELPLESNKVLDLAKVSYTSNIGRSHFKHRIGFTGSNLSELMKKMSLYQPSSTSVMRTTCNSIVFVFHGLKGQNLAANWTFCKEIYETSHRFKFYFDQCAAIMNTELDTMVIELESDSQELKRPSIFIPLVFITEYALASLWIDLLSPTVPTFAMGHGIGEYTAACLTGLISVLNAVTILNKLGGILEDNFIPSTQLQSPLMNAFLLEFSHVLSALEVGSPKNNSTQFVSGLTGTISNKTCAKHWLTHLSTEPKWMEAMNVVKENGATIFIGLGLGSLPNNSNSDSSITMIDASLARCAPSPWVSLLEAARKLYENGIDINFEILEEPRKYHTTILPTYAFIRKRHWAAGLDEHSNSVASKSVGISQEPASLLSDTMTSHPLLGTRTRLSNYLTVYRTTLPLTGVHMYLKDHQVLGIQIVPATTFMEIFFGVAKDIISTGRGKNNNCIEITDFEIQSPLRLSEEEGSENDVLTEIQTLVEITDENFVFAVEIGSRRIYRNADEDQESGAPDEWMCHAKGILRILTKRNTPASTSALSTLVELQDSGEKITLTSFYSKIRDFGIDYGPNFRFVKSIWDCGRQTLSELKGNSVKLTRLSKEHGKEYVVHPAILDSGLHAVFTQFRSNIGQIGTTYLPIAAERITCNLDVVGKKPLKYSLARWERDLTMKEVSNRLSNARCPIFISRAVSNELVSKLASPATSITWRSQFGRKGRRPSLRCSIVDIPMASSAETMSTSFTLYDQEGTSVMEIDNFKMRRTNTTAVMETLSDKVKLKDWFYEEAWIPMAQTTLPTTTLFTHVPEVFPEFQEMAYYLSKQQNLPNFKESMLEIGRFSLTYFVECFSEMGWEPRIGDSIELQAWMKEYYLDSAHEKLLRKILKALAGQGILQPVGTTRDQWKVVKTLPSKNDYMLIRAEIESKYYEFYKLEFRLVRRCGLNLLSMLRRETNPLDMLFPDSGSSMSEENEKVDASSETSGDETGAEELYHDSPASRTANLLLAKILVRILKQSDLKDQTGSGGRKELRILEIGAGTGGTTKQTINYLEEMGISYMYTFTDLSRYFFNKAKMNYTNVSSKIEFRTLNIEEDLSDQGFSMNSYDVIVAANVLHATRDIWATMLNVKNLLRIGGLLLVVEATEPSLWYDVTFGLLPGWWLFDDRFRVEDPLLSPENWKLLLTKLRFSFVDCIESYPSVILGVNGDRDPLHSEEAEDLNDSTPPNIKHAPIWLICDPEETGLSQGIINEIGIIGRAGIKVGGPDLESFKYQLDSSLTDLIELEGIVFLGNTPDQGVGTEFDDVPARSLALCSYFLELIQCILNFNIAVKRRILFVTVGCVAVYPGDKVQSLHGSSAWGMARTARRELPNYKLVTLDLEATTAAATLITQIYQEMFSTNDEVEVAIRNQDRLTCRLQLSNPTRVSLGIGRPNSKFYEVVADGSGSVSSLSLRKKENTEGSSQEVVIQVKASSLNFKDVLILMGEVDKSREEQLIGTDFSGVVTSVGSEVKGFEEGDEVVGLSTVGTLSNLTFSKSEMLMRLPKGLTFEQGATIPSVFLTVYHSLVVEARLKSGENVLIHSACGGVGLAAIQIAKYVGAEIFATAGSVAKRDYLKATLGIQYVFDSRSTKFSEEIRALEVGIDVVLNSLTGPNFIQAAVDACKPNARFVELSIRNTWSIDEMKANQPDIQYSTVEMDRMDPLVIQKYFQVLSTWFEQGILHPLPYALFTLQSSVQGLQLLQHGKNIGKVVITTRAETSFERVSFRSDGTYLITGAFGGLGISLIRRMVMSGAKHFMLFHRSPATPVNQKILFELSNGCGELNIRTCQVDVGNYEALAKALRETQNGMPPLIGIFHLAGSLDDGTLMNQTVSKFQTVFQAKVFGSWNLHCLTKSLPLEHFVLFSSVAGIFGNPGQGNHAAGNAFMDSLAQYRNSLGYPALSIEWGAWSQIGAAASLHKQSTKFGIKGLLPISPIAGWKSLETVLQNGIPKQMICPTNWETYFSEMGANEMYMTLLHDKFIKPKTNRRQSLGRILSNLECSVHIPETGKFEFVRDVVVQKLKDVAGLGVDTLDPYVGFAQYGVDSLMSIELRNKLQKYFSQVQLSPTTMFDYPNPNLLSEYITSQLPMEDDTMGFHEFAEEEVKELTEPEPLPPSTPKSEDNDEPIIVVVGMSCRFPGTGGKSPEEFWKFLTQGGNSIIQIPSSRWDSSQFYDTDSNVPNKIYSNEGSFLADEFIHEFDAQFFNLSPLEAKSLDPQQRLLLLTTWEALERAGTAPTSLRGTSTGVFIGISSNDFSKLLSRGNGGEGGHSLFMSTGNAFSTAAGRLSYFFGFEGPAMSIDTACSSSLVSIHSACQSIRMGECTTAIVGGTNIILSPESSIHFCKGGMISRTGQCRSFDSSADGFVRGEGCGVVVIKKLSEAIKDRNPILGIIRGSAVNQDGSSSGLTVPNGTAQESLIRMALRMSGCEPGDISYIETHGTGTALGDPIEVNSLQRVFESDFNAKNPLTIGSVKTNIGHLEAASGIAGFIKVLLSMNAQAIPPHLHFETINTNIISPDMFDITAMLTPWNTPNGKPRISGVSSFGYSGTNAHVVLQEYVKPEMRHSSKSNLTRPLRVVTISARSPTSLKMNIKKIDEYLAEHSSELPNLEDFVYTLNAGRAHFQHRFAVVIESFQQLREALNAPEEFESKMGGNHKLVLIFDGEGIKSPGIGQNLYATSPIFKTAFDLCAQIFLKSIRIPLLDILFSPELLTEELYSKVVLFTLQYSAVQLGIAAGFKPDFLYCRGSVGEYLGACTAGIISVHDAIQLLVLSCKMNIAAAERSKLSPEEQETNSNSREADQNFERVACNLVYNFPAKYNFVSSITGELFTEGTTDSFYWIKHYHSWKPGADPENEYNRGTLPEEIRKCNIFLNLSCECSDAIEWIEQQILKEAPGPENLLFLKSALDTETTDSWSIICTNLVELYRLGFDFDFETFDGPYAKEKLCLPTYQFEPKVYWPIDVNISPDWGFGSTRKTENIPETSTLPAVQAVEDASSVRQTVVKILKEVGEYDVDIWKDDTDFNEIGLNSIMTLQIRNRLMAAFGNKVVLPTTLLYDFNTFGQLVAHLTKLYPRSDVTTKKTEMSESDARKVLLKIEAYPIEPMITFQIIPKTVPIFLIHPGYGFSHVYRPLIPHLPSRSIYGLNNPILCFPELSLTDIDGIFQTYIRLIKKTQPSGPYTFIGWSAGGITSIILAQMLETLGDRVGTIVMIDGYSQEMLPILRKVYIKSRDEGLLGNISTQVDLDVVEVLLEPIGKILLHGFKESSADAKYSGRVVNIKARSQVFFDNPEDAVDPFLLRYVDDPFNGFQHILPKIELYSMDGEHYTILDSEESRETIGDIVNRVLVQEQRGYMDSRISKTSPMQSHIFHAARIGDAFLFDRLMKLVDIREILTAKDEHGMRLADIAYLFQQQSILGKLLELEIQNAEVGLK